MTKDILLNKNFQYCIMFLKHSGERVRAIRLVVDVAGISGQEAKSWVDNLTWRDAELVIKPMNMKP